MLRLPISAMFLVLLLTCFCLSSVSVRSVKSFSETIIVPDDYPTIQEAIDRANEGDTVFVKSGLYVQSLFINKAITLLGENRTNTIIEGQQYVWDVIAVDSDNVTISGFTIRGGGNGILAYSSNCLFYDNILTGNDGGIFLDGRLSYHVENNTIMNNIIANNRDAGIVGQSVTGNNILFNTVEVNRHFGIVFFAGACLNLVKQNEIMNNEDTGVAFFMGASENVLEHNNVSGNGWNTPEPVFCAGVALGVMSHLNTVANNNIWNNKIGFYQWARADGNTIYHNSVFNNLVQVYDDPINPCSNIWNGSYSSGGNYWSDYSGVDKKSGPYQNLTGTDGIGDTPYVIDGSNIDHYPLMRPYVFVLGDLNNDDKVNMIDIGIAASAFGSFPGYLRWNPEVDINKDGIIDLRDIAIVARNFRMPV